MSKPKKKPAERKPRLDPNTPVATVVDRDKFAAFCAESSVVLHHLFDRLQDVLGTKGHDDWIDRDRLRETCYLIESACNKLAVMPIKPHVELPNPLEVLTLGDVERRLRS